MENKKYWKGGAIHVAPNGEIIKVVDLNGEPITGEDEVPAVPERVKKSLIFLSGDTDEERCVYGANGRCYCS